MVGTVSIPNGLGQNFWLRPWIPAFAGMTQLGEGLHQRSLILAQCILGNLADTAERSD
jgi:hypothetical protein